MPFYITHYLSAQSAYAPQFGPAGQSIFFIADISGVPQLWRVPYRPGQEMPFWPEQCTFGEERVLGLHVSPGGAQVLISRDVGGNEKAQLLHWREDAPPHLLTAGHEGALHSFGCWSPDGSWFVFAANRRHPGRFDLYRQHVDRLEAECIWEHEQSGYLLAADIAPDGSRAAVIRMAASAKHELFELDLATGALRRLHDPALPARFHAAFYGPAGDELIILTDRDYDFMHIARLNLDTLAVSPLVRETWDVMMLQMAGDRQRLAYALNVAGDSTLHVRELGGAQMLVAPSLGPAPGVVGMKDGRLAFDARTGRVAFSYTSATRTSDIYVWDPAQEHVEPVTRCAHGGIPPHTFIAPELIDYPTFDGRRIPAWWYRPGGAAGGKKQPLPVVVLVHGGPESQIRPYYHFLVQYLVHHGYAVLAPNVRGSTGYGRHYSSLDDVEKRMDSVADLAHAAHWLRTRPDVDPERIAVYGGSYGGFMVLSALTTYPDLWAAGVNVVGISNFVTFLENTSDYRRAHRESEYGRLDRDRDFLESISPNNHLQNITAPLLVIHGANDPRVPLSEAEQLVAALDERDIPVRLLVFDDEGHGIFRLANKRVAYPAIVEFLSEFV